MVEFKWINMSLFLMVLLFTGVKGQNSSFTVRVGDEVTLPCENVINDQVKCGNTTWLFTNGKVTAELVNLGQLKEESKSDRLSVTENCSLVVKKVTVEGAGRYICRQFDKSGKIKGPDYDVYLTVVATTKQEDGDKVTLSCSVSTYVKCRHTVKWVFQGKAVDKDHSEIKTSESDCLANVTIKKSHFISASNDYKSLKCNVTDKETGEQRLFNVTLQTSGEKTDKDTSIETTATTKSTLIESTAAPTVDQGFPDWAKFVAVAVGLVALLILFVVFFRWKRNKGNRTQTDDKTADPEDGVFYTSISYTRTTNRKAQDEDAVTYSTVKASSSF